MSLLVALLLSQFTVQNQGAPRGSVSGVDCQGVGNLSCTVQGNKWILKVDGGTSSSSGAVYDGGPAFDSPLYNDGGTVGCLAASASIKGCVDTGTQSMAGDKTFLNSVTFENFVNYYRSDVGNAFFAQAYPRTINNANWLIDLANNFDITNSGSIWLGTVGTTGWVTNTLTGNLVGSTRRGAGVTKNLYLFAKDYPVGGYNASDMSLTVEANTGRVGIGTTTPKESLDVSTGGIGLRGPITFLGGSGTFLSHESTGGYLISVTPTVTLLDFTVEVKEWSLKTGIGVGTERLHITAGGVSTFSGTLTASNLSGTNTGDQTKTCGASTWVSTLNTGTSSSCTQPSYSDLSGSPTTPSNGGDTSTFLRGDGTWAQVPVVKPTSVASIPLTKPITIQSFWPKCSPVQKFNCNH